MKGFTLIELVIVLIVLGILSVGAFFKWDAETIDLGAETDKVAQAIRYTQSLSMAKNQRYRMVIASSTTYQITNSSGTAIIQPNGSTTITLNSDVRFATISNLPNNLVAFDSKGSPYIDTGTPGTALSSTATINLMAVTSGNNKSITIAPQTGKVTIQ